MSSTYHCYHQAPCACGNCGGSFQQDTKTVPTVPATPNHCAYTTRGEDKGGVKDVGLNCLLQNWANQKDSTTGTYHTNPYHAKQCPQGSSPAFGLGWDSGLLRNAWATSACGKNKTRTAAAFCVPDDCFDSKCCGKDYCIPKVQHTTTVRCPCDVFVPKSPPAPHKSKSPYVPQNSDISKCQYAAYWGDKAGKIPKGSDKHTTLVPCDYMCPSATTQTQ
jgi:hypothetical protein